jgi:hypothetical protein
METIRNGIIVIFIGVVIMFAGQSDYELEQRDNAHYCDMTGQGLWGAFDSSIKCK